MNCWDITHKCLSNSHRKTKENYQKYSYSDKKFLQVEDYMHIDDCTSASCEKFSFCVFFFTGASVELGANLLVLPLWMFAVEELASRE